MSVAHKAAHKVAKDEFVKQLAPRVPRYELVAADDGRVRLAEGRIDDGPILQGRMQNLSASGALVQIEESTARLRFLDEGEMIKVELAIPDRGRFAFFATVVRVDPSTTGENVWEMGLAFRNLPKSLSQALDRSVTTRSRDYSHPHNFDFAATKGYRYASYRLTPTRLLALLNSTVGKPLWWLAILAFTTMTILPFIVTKLTKFF
jgi:hypothetical protein